MRVHDRAVWAEIDLAAIRRNLEEIRNCVRGGAKLCAVVKANAYGHGAVAVARAAVDAGASYLAVAILEEALELRSAGFCEPVLILGYTPPEQAPQIVAHNVTQTIFSLEAAAALSAEAMRQGKAVKVHLKVDTGMGRIGVRPEEAGVLAARIASLPGVELEGVFSHFASSDSADKTAAVAQLMRFREALRCIEAAGVQIAIRHIANSAAILEMPESHFDMVRAGIILYGLWPSDEVTHGAALHPAMRLKARISYVKEMPAGEAISYGGAFRTARKSRIATLPIGYADGYSRLLSGKAEVEVGSVLAPVVGRICMDQCMLDVSDAGDVHAGDEVTLFGGTRMSAAALAWRLGTIHYEVVCTVGARVPRVYV